MFLFHDRNAIKNMYYITISYKSCKINVVNAHDEVYKKELF